MGLDYGVLLNCSCIVFFSNTKKSYAYISRISRPAWWRAASHANVLWEKKKQKTLHSIIHALNSIPSMSTIRQLILRD